jgi:hypothetical protein
MARRRSFSVISMSFLDAMTCGFGAVILFFMIIAANVDLRRETVLEDRSSEVDRLELQVLVGRRNLAEIKQDLADLLTERASSSAVREQIVAEVQRTRSEISRLSRDSTANREQIEQLETDLAALESRAEEIEADNPEPVDAGNFIREIRGEGYRQYLTGLRMGGERVLILVDVSTSMLDRTLVNILRRRNMSPEDQRRAPKWRQIVDSVNWLTAQITPDTQFQVIAFNSEAWSLVDGTDGQWLSARDGSQLQQAVDALNEITPSGPTSLYAAFAAANELQPKPDNIFLLVDGLPTMGEVLPARAGVTGKERQRHFERALRDAPVNVPINVLLYAMEGDPLAAPAYWRLALGSGGSMMAPSEDWP